MTFPENDIQRTSYSMKMTFGGNGIQLEMTSITIARWQWSRVTSTCNVREWIGDNWNSQKTSKFFTDKNWFILCKLTWIETLRNNECFVMLSFRLAETPSHTGLLRRSPFLLLRCRCKQALWDVEPSFWWDPVAWILFPFFFGILEKGFKGMSRERRAGDGD